MKTQSNIFVYIELAKLVSNLDLNLPLSKQRLKSQASYFEIIPARYFSAGLSGQWRSITMALNIADPLPGKKTSSSTHAICNTIDQMSADECQALTSKIRELFEKVKLEFV